VQFLNTNVLNIIKKFLKKVRVSSSRHRRWNRRKCTRVSD